MNLVLPDQMSCQDFATEMSLAWHFDREDRRTDCALARRDHGLFSWSSSRCLVRWIILYECGSSMLFVEFNYRAAIDETVAMFMMMDGEG
jgi:hypothetical protein